MRGDHEARDAVQVLRRGQERAAAEAIAAGHANYPSLRHFFPNDELRARILGRALVKPILERADRDGVVAASRQQIPTTSRSITRLGFDVVDTAFSPIPGGPALTTFRRSPPGYHDLTKNGR
jgi:hypothetical protein